MEPDHSKMARFAWGLNSTLGPLAKACPYCQQEKGMNIDPSEYVAPSVARFEGNPKAPTLRIRALTCQNCGFLLLFDGANFHK